MENPNAARAYLWLFGFTVPVVFFLAIPWIAQWLFEIFAITRGSRSYYAF